MSDDLSLSIEGEGVRRICRLAGHLDTHTFERADAALDALLADARITQLVFDFSELRYISSAGLRTLFRARKVLGARGGRVLVANPQAQIRKVLDIVKAVPADDVAESTAAAEASLDASSGGPAPGR
jgi:anti-anti-sigma factor